jgi:hypothetical protein
VADDLVARTTAGMPGLADQAAAQGWQPVTGPPFRHDVVDGIHDITRAMYGDSRLMDTSQRAVGETKFSDAFRARIDGRTVIVANANTFIDPGLFQAGRFSLTGAGPAGTGWSRGCSRRSA